jgi:dTDP-glucose 4,6-dehydratase
MKLLVTGGLGFIGSNFILYLLKNHQEYEIVNLDAEFYGSNNDNLQELSSSDKYRLVIGNICNLELVDKLIVDCDAVVNFAAESHVDRSIANAKPFLESNIDGVFSLLECVKKYEKKFLQISTDEVFGSLEKDSATEIFPFNPSSPYAATKASAEMLVNSYHITYGCDTIITRCTNNYGPRQFPEKLIPKVILLAEQNKKIPVYGSGKNLRDWIFVDDHCKAIHSVLKNGKSGQSYNISSNNEIDNVTIIKKILSIMGKSNNLIEFVEDRPGHDFRYSMNSNKLRNELGWIPKINFDEGIKNTIDWYLSNPQWRKDLSDQTFQHTPWKK